jgi:hypothetical protein
METAEMRFLLPVTGYRMMDRKSNEDITEKMGITGSLSVIKCINRIE